MIARLRRRHRRMVLGLAFAAPLVLAAALLSRTVVPADDTLARAVAAQLVPPDAVPLERHVVTVGAQPVELAVHAADTQAPARLVIERGEPHASSPPDVLVYWQSQTPAARPATDAHLLGRWAPHRRNVYALPAGTARGAVVFYSLAQDAIVGSRWPVAIAEGPQP